MEETFNSGAILDTRPKEEKEKDFRTEEVVVSFAEPEWRAKTDDELRKFPIFNQDGSGSCVAQTEAKELGIMRWLRDGIYVHFSATDIYQRRVNRPQAGMISNDARKIAQEGVTLEVLVPSQSMTDNQMDSAPIEPYKRQIGEVFSVSNYLEDPMKDIDAIASVIQATGKGVMTWYYFKNDEWNASPMVKYPDLDLYAPSTARHSVTATDFALVGGKKCLVIEDSWGPGTGMGGRRYISEDFFIARNFHASHLMNFRFAEQGPVQPTKPKYKFLRNLEWKPTFFTDKDVKALQNILKYEGLFPANVDSTGYYGSITAMSVKAWQIKHNVASLDEIEALQGKVVGPKTRTKLNSIYG